MKSVYVICTVVLSIAAVAAVLAWKEHPWMACALALAPIVLGVKVNGHN